MGLLDLFKRRPEGSAVYRERDRSMRLSVVGEANYQAALLRVSGAPRSGDFGCEDCMAELVPDPTNKYDPEAIMVRIDGECVGYLSRSDARAYGPAIREMVGRGESTLCCCFVGRGPDSPNLGVNLRLPADSPLFR